MECVYRGCFKVICQYRWIMEESINERKFITYIVNTFSNITATTFIVTSKVSFINYKLINYFVNLICKI